jgi:arylsulfatase A-like enzyme
MGLRLRAVLIIAVSTGCRGGDSVPTPPLHLLGVPYIIFAPEGEAEMESPVTLDGDARGALVAPTPAEFRYRVKVPENPLLTFSLGIGASGSASEQESPPFTHMRFTVRAGEKSADVTLFDREIHMSRRDRWLPQSVELRRFAGREIWLVFQTSVPNDDGASGPLPVAGVFADPILHHRGAYRTSRGIVLVSIDTLRRDHTSLYGYRRRTTPGLEALARESVVFEDAVSTSSWTLPAHASLLTSTRPSVHGATSSKVALSPEWEGLPRALKEQGYFTQAMTTHVYLSKDYGFGEGFDRLHYLPETRAEGVTDQAIRFLEARGDSNFFLFLHYYDPHWHYDPPAPYDREFDPAYRGDASGIWWDFKELDADSIDPRDLNHIQALYDGEILYTDRHVERLVREMKRVGVFENAMVVVTSDHGEEFLDHGLWEHQKTLYEEQVRVPLLIKFPEGVSVRRRLVSDQVSLVDVAPTILDTLGAPLPPTFEGRSLLGAARGLKAEDVAEAWAETEHTLDGSHKVAVRRGASSEKVIFTLKDGGVEIELFDLKRDPGERSSLDAAGARTALEGRLRAYLASSEARRSGKTRPEVELSPEDLERLRALGYVK